MFKIWIGSIDQNKTRIKLRIFLIFEKKESSFLSKESDIKRKTLEK
jgi:hypothetical protein